MTSAGRSGIWKMARARKQTSDSGQSMVEFAMTVPIMVLLLIAVVGFAWMLYFFVTLNSAAREGARYAIGHPQATETEIGEYVKDNTGILSRSGVGVDVEPEDPIARVPRSQVTVTVRYTFQIVNVTIPYVIAPGSFTMFPPIYFAVVSTMNLD